MNLVDPALQVFHFEDAKRALKPLFPRDIGEILAPVPAFRLGLRCPFPHDLDLVDSRQKRAVLNHVIRNADLSEGRAPITVHCSRIEALQTGPYDGIMARALAKPEEVMNLTEFSFGSDSWCYCFNRARL